MVRYKTMWFGLIFVVLSNTANIKVAVHASQCKLHNKSVFGYRLRNHVVYQNYEGGVFKCAKRCTEQCFCHSMNYRIADTLCELNSARKTSHIKDYGPDDEFIYMEFENSKTFYKSCMDLKTANPSAASGYYNLVLKDRCLVAYCDMNNYGGGWTLVVSISNQNNDHLQIAQHNCLNSSVCVPHDIAAIQSRKLSDNEIHLLAASEGTFRVKVLPAAGAAYDVFYQIPSGQENFNSSCIGMERTCPRIITSYSPFPYVWESNCKGISMGYFILNGCHRVFDSHSDEECGRPYWLSSQYFVKRALYGYPCPSHDPPHDSKGIYRNQNGMLFVR